MIEFLKKNSEIIVSVSALIVSILALIATYQQGEMTRTHNSKSVKPILTPHLTEKSLAIVNAGLGPAIIENFTIKIDGEPLVINTEDDLNKAINKLNIPKNKEFEDTFVQKKTPLPPGEEIIVFEFKQTSIDILEKIGLHIIYKDIYDADSELIYQF